MTAVVPNPLCPLPDRTVALPALGFEISPAGLAEADRLRTLPPAELFHRLLRDQESDAVVLSCRRLIEAFVTSTEQPAPRLEQLPAALAAARAELAGVLGRLAGYPDPVRRLVLRERAPLSLLAGCWLDMASQPATQPSVLVNQLYAQYFAQRGGGIAARSQQDQRRRRLAAQDITLPDLGAHDFLSRAEARPLTAWQACWYLALSRLPANFLPEVAGVQYAFTSLGVDDALLGTEPLLEQQALEDLRAEFAARTADPASAGRFSRAVQLTILLERQHVEMLTELADWHEGLPLESRVAEIIRRHAPMAGRQHGRVRVGGTLLAEAFPDPGLDVAAFLEQFRESPYLRGSDGLSPFTTAMKFGGPMFGIFDEAEAAVFREWVAASQRGERPQVTVLTNQVGEGQALRWARAFRQSEPRDIRVADPVAADVRELFHRLVNIENFPNTLVLAREQVQGNLLAAEVLFEHGAGGRYTDASWFDYSPQALYERGERVYWDKLVDPYQPLVEIPDRDEVIFTQSTYALGYLIDGAWLHKLGNTGHFERESDRMLFAIYADEMGHGDLVKNHITLTHRVLHSLGIDLPHIRTGEFREQADLPDDLYGFSLHQLSLCLLPDTFYNEILGYNYAIEMFGSGELRLHEMQKLRQHGFDDCYEQAHLAIDNFSAGHTRQAADIIVSYLDGVRRTAGADVVQQEWRRIWRGYASFALFVEHALLKRVNSGTTTTTTTTAQQPASAEPDPLADLLI
jgi:hypothetical protein